MNDCIVIIPTYNEIENIESIIRAAVLNKLFHDSLLMIILPL
jgi:dolichol-phosphate mannosyltransferase